MWWIFRLGVGKGCAVAPRAGGAGFCGDFACGVGGGAGDVPEGGIVDGPAVWEIGVGEFAVVKVGSDDVEDFDFIGHRTSADAEDIAACVF